MKISVLGNGFVRLVDSMPKENQGDYTTTWGPGDQRIVDAARVTSGLSGAERTVDQNKSLVRYLVKNKHTSPLEKVRFEFHVKAPIFVARQWFRHRTGSYSEQSARYSELHGGYYIPDSKRMVRDSKTNRQGSGEDLPKPQRDTALTVLKEATEASNRAYRRLLELGLTRELARSVLPFNTYTEFWYGIDLHNLIHFLKLRLDSHSQYEITQYAHALCILASYVTPFTIAAALDLESK